MNEQNIRNYIQRILSEGEENQKPAQKKGKKIKVGEIGLSVGRGAFTKVVADAGALAKNNPKQLMKNLEIKGGGNGLDGVIKILKQAVQQSTMNKAYGGSVGTVTKGERKGVMVSTDEIGARNGAKFLHHTLMGAMAAGVLTSDVPLQIQVTEDGVVIHTGSNKGNW
jgi:hypothetical protein